MDIKFPTFWKRSQIQEHFDWLIVKYASEICRDEDATLALSLRRIIDHELVRLQTELTCYRDPESVDMKGVTPKQAIDHCELLSSRINDLKRQRRQLLYHGYRVKEKLKIIYAKAMQNDPG